MPGIAPQKLAISLLGLHQPSILGCVPGFAEQLLELDPVRPGLPVP
jgi:hypothetical protein